MILSLRISNELREELESLAAKKTRTLAHQAEHTIKLGLRVVHELNDVDDIAYVIARLVGRDQRPAN